MTQFTINSNELIKLFQINQFEIPKGCSLVFIGIRGCLPMDTSDTSFKNEQTLVLREIDYKNLRCTFLQWNNELNQIAAFAGSTVPSIANILGFKAVPPRKSNCLTPGFYKNYIKGKHRPAKTQNWHDAFRQEGQPLAIRRTYNNTSYDNFDTIEVSVGCDDNIHASWTMDEDSGYFSSAGCQVIKGIPLCESTSATQHDNQGPWKVFKDNGYFANQAIFPYALFNSSELFKLINSSGKQIPAIVKFGAKGALVSQVQTALINLNYLLGNPDGDYGKNTFEALKKFQTEKFGIAAVDCVVGTITSKELGISLPIYELTNQQLTSEEAPNILRSDQKGFDFIKNKEGLKLTAYQDSANIWTIGYGSIAYENLTPVKKGDRISIEQADQLLQQEIIRKGAAVNSAVTPAILNQNQFNALVSFTYNVGLGALLKSTLLKLVKANNLDPEIRNAFAMWDKAHVDGQLVSIPGLAKRRKEEANLYFA